MRPSFDLYITAARTALTLSIALLTPTTILAQPKVKVPETFFANAQVRGNEAGSSATVTIHIEQYSADKDRTKVEEALRSGGYSAFLQALRGAPEVGYVEMNGRKVAVRWARMVPAKGKGTLPDDEGRTITVVAESPIFFVGGGSVDAKPREGFDVAVIQLEVDSIGLGSGSMAAAANVKTGGATGVQIGDYAETPIKLVTVRRSYQ